MSFHNKISVKKTRKEYKCDGCLEKMPIGSQAKRGSGVFEGDFYSYIICITCNAFLEENIDYFVDGWSEGDIAEARKDEDYGS